MYIFSPIDIQRIRPPNPFVAELNSALEFKGCLVEHGKYRLSYPSKKWDVVHFQWPEYTLDKVTAESISWLDSLMKRMRLHSRIVLTVHNEAPHMPGMELQELLYRTVYANVDGFIHMGEESVRRLIASHPLETAHKKHVVIPHGNYSIYGEKVDKAVAREKLNIRADSVVLVVGALRHQGEVDLVFRSAREWASPNCKLLFAARMVTRHTNMHGIGGVVTRIKAEAKKAYIDKFVQKSSHCHYVKAPVPYENMADLLSAADVLLVPRERVLNSGNVALGFTYGCVVVGPRTGNVGEILERYGNPTFTVPIQSPDVTHAVRRAIDLAKSGLGASNASVALADWNWGVVAEKHIGFYKELVTDTMAR